MQDFPQSLESVAALPPDFNPQAVSTAVRVQYGLSGHLQTLVSERDQNFRLQTDDGESYVVKIASGKEEEETTALQIAALLHLESEGISNVPRVVRTTAGADCGSIAAQDSTQYRLRVVSWVDGELFQQLQVTPEMAEQLGRKLASVDLALQSFSHPGQRRELLWDSTRASDLQGLVQHIPDSNLRARIERVLGDFRNRVSIALEALPAQVIHNDANPENVLQVSPGVGLIDFGDLLYAPRIVELSTAAAYLRAEQPEYLIAPLLRGYRSLTDLQPAELMQLFDLTRTRLAMTVVILYWRLSARDADDPYCLKSAQGERGAIEFLERLDAMGREDFLRRVDAAPAR
jgi:Ser/Thr protein kinase RdoA (MazF antagonist)